MSDDLIIAIPSKGRLQEKTHNFFARAGLTVERPGGNRNYQGRLKGVSSVAIAFLSASEITRELAAGSVHVGVTGVDLVQENISEPTEKTHLIAPLGFGHADVVVALPKAWIDVSTMADLGDVASDFRAKHGRRLRVATKYVTLTRSFFAAHGISDYRIVESSGATEGAPAAGSAELIVDITSTGATLSANNLKIPEDGIILNSQAHLVASLTAPWGQKALDSIEQILDRVAAEAKAHAVREVRSDLPISSLQQEEIASTFAATRPFGGDGGIIHCPVDNAPALASWLRQNGAATVSISALSYIFETENPLFQPLADKLAV
ncbi:MAG: ATP phosphoribosyltransferase [Stappiaceae bacterium]